MSNNLRVNVLNGVNYQMPQFQVSSAYTKGATAKTVKIGSTYPVLPYVFTTSTYISSSSYMYL